MSRIPLHTRTANRAPVRVAVVGALTAAACLAGAGSAFAHVTVHPDSYAQGAADGTLTFRIPNEDDSASTTKVDITFPVDHPIPSVMVTAEPGWTAQVKSTKLSTPIKTDDGDITDAVSEIIWTGGKIQPGQYQDFSVAFGALPTGVDQLVFKTLQTYSGGKITRWIEEPKPGQDEPENPAPVLKLTAPAAADGTDSADGADGADSAKDSTATPSVSSSPAPVASQVASVAASDGTARGLGIAGLVVGLLGLIAGGLGLARARATRH